MKNIVRTFVAAFSLCALLHSLTGCGSLMFMVNKEKIDNYTISSTDYDNAFSMAVKAITEMGLSIFTSDKSSGTIYASKGTGFDEITELNFALFKEKSGLSFMIKVKSSGGDKATEEFLKRYRKYVKINEGVSASSEANVPAPQPVAKKPDPQLVASESKVEPKSEAVSAKQESNTSIPSRFVITENKAKLRKLPSTNAGILKTLKKGEAVNIVKEKDDWFLVELAGGETGWCHKSILSKAQ